MPELNELFKNRSTSSGVVTEVDQIALGKLAEAKTALEASIKTKVDAIEMKLTSLDAVKADKTALNTAVSDLNTAIAAGATQVELDAAIKKVEDEIAALKAAPDVGTWQAEITKLKARTRRESRAPQESEIDGTWDTWYRYDPNGDTAISQIYWWVGENNVITNGPVTLSRVFAHSNASSVPGGTWLNTLPRDVKLSYKTTLDAQNNGYFFVSFPKGVVKQIWASMQNAQGLELSNGGGDAGPDNTTWVMNAFCGDINITQIVWRITYTDNKIINYTVPVER